MEKITNYTLKEFLLLEDEDLVTSYITLMELLEPAEDLRSLRDLTFGQVTLIRENLANPTIEKIADCIALLLEIEIQEVFDLGIIEFYSILSNLREQAQSITQMEINAWSDDDEASWEYEAVGASQRLAKYGVLNTINSLAGDDITKWKEIQEMPYMLVFTKLTMDKDRAKINKEVQELQKRKQSI